MRSNYPALPFHSIRTVSFTSSAVTTSILAVFIYHLRNDGYKLPFAFLVLLVSATLSILSVLLSSLVNCTCGLPIRLSIFLNTFLCLLWAVSIGLMSWSMSHTIQTGCTTTYWGNSTGVAVCRTYKTLFSFTIAGFAACIAALWQDMTVRRRQKRPGVYGIMGSEPGLGMMGGNAPSALPYVQTLEQGHAGEAQQFHDAASARSRRGAPRVKLSEYGKDEANYDPMMYR